LGGGLGATEERLISVGELLVVGDQAGEASLEREWSGVGAFAAYRAVVGSRAGDCDEPSGGGVEYHGLLVAFEFVADDAVAGLGQRLRDLFGHRLRRPARAGRPGRGA